MQDCVRHLTRLGVTWQGRWVDVNSELVHLVEEGSGEPLILLHGFLVWSYFWRKVLPGLASFARVIAPDLRGFGLTERSDHRPLDLWAQADLVVGLMDQLGLDRAVICGHSMGGEVALRVAMRYPERVSGLILVSSAGYVRSERPWWERRVLGMPGLGRLIVRVLLANKRYAGRAMREAYYEQRMNEVDLAAYLLPGRLPKTSRTLARMLLEVDFGATIGELHQVEHPTQILWGKEDPWIPVAHGERLVQTLPNSTLELFSPCGHSPPEESPGPFVDAVRRFWGCLGLLDPLVDPESPAP
jgi:pimeloyl-ACP methyl ester carboxylesterase